MIRFRRDVRAWLINAAQRWCGAGFVVTLACFVAITTYPYEPLNPFARSAFAVPASGGFRFDTPSVFRTPTGIAQLDSEAFRQGRFSVELWVKPEHATQHESSRFVSYSLDEEHPLWMVSQRGEQISIKHRGRGAYVRTLEIDSLRHYVVALAGDRAHVYRDGQHVATRQLLPATVQPWHSSHLTVANEVTGDRPFIGAIRQLTLFSRTLSAEEIRRIAAGEAVEPPGFTLEGNPSEQRLWLNSSPPIPLERVPWPYRHKWELSRPPYFSVWHLVADIVLNVVATLPTGLFLRLLLQRWWHARPGWHVARVTVFHCCLSLAVEAAQFFSTEVRFPSWIDVTTNTLGGLMGATLIYRYIQQASLPMGVRQPDDATGSAGGIPRAG